MSGSNKMPWLGVTTVKGTKLKVEEERRGWKQDKTKTGLALTELGWTLAGVARFRDGGEGNK